MKKSLSLIAAVLILIGGCSWSSLNPFSSDEATIPEESGVNHYLWEASVNKLAFMPMQISDATGGLLLTDWENMGGAKGEEFQITVQVLSKHLRVNCLAVKVAKRKFENGKWEEVSVDPRLAQEIKKSILSEARDLYRKDLAAKGE